MKAKELKQLLEQLDDETEIGVHIVNGKCDGTELMHLINDQVNNRQLICVAHEDDVIK